MPIYIVRSALLTAGVVSLSGVADAALIAETFDTNDGFTTSVQQFVMGDDYFFNTSGPLSFAADTEAEFFGADGGFFAAQDLDGPPALTSSRQTITFDAVSLPPATVLSLDVDLAEDDDGDSEDWDAPDSVVFEISFDGGAFTPLLTAASTDESRGGDDFNGFPVVNGVEVTDTFQTFSVAGIDAGGAAEAVLRIVIDLNSGDEDIAIDNVTLIPAPGAAVLVIAALATASLRRRGRYVAPRAVCGRFGR